MVGGEGREEEGRWCNNTAYGACSSRMQRRQHAMQFSCRPHHRCSVLARNLPRRVVPALFPPTLLALFPTPPFHYRANFSRFPIRFPRYFIYTYICVCVCVCISMFKTGKWQNSGNGVTARQPCFARFLAGQSCPARRRPRGEKFEGSRARCALPLATRPRDIKSYLRLRYVR